MESKKEEGATNSLHDSVYFGVFIQKIRQFYISYEHWVAVNTCANDVNVLVRPAFWGQPLSFVRPTRDLKQIDIIWGQWPNAEVIVVPVQPSLEAKVG